MHAEEMTRTELQEYLEARGFAVYCDEDTEKLREAARLNQRQGLQEELNQ